MRKILEKRVQRLEQQQQLPDKEQNIALVFALADESDNEAIQEYRRGNLDEPAVDKFVVIRRQGTGFVTSAYDSNILPLIEEKQAPPAWITEADCRIWERYCEQEMGWLENNRYTSKEGL